MTGLRNASQLESCRPRSSSIASIKGWRVPSSLDLGRCGRPVSRLSRVPALVFLGKHLDRENTPGDGGQLSAIFSATNLLYI